MTTQSRVREKLANKVFNKLGSSTVLEAWSSTVVDKWGDSTPAYESSTSITTVPYNLFDYREEFRPFGDLQEGETDMVVPYDTTIDKKDKITLLGTEYVVKERESYVISGGVVAYVIRVAKII